MLHLFGQLFRFMRVYRKFWLAPIIFGLIGIGGLLVLAQSSALSPFIYALF
jgi:Family of unknown function (DUF5989)